MNSADNFLDGYSFEFPINNSPDLEGFPPDESPEFHEEPADYSLESWRSVALRRGDELFDVTLKVYELEREVLRLRKMLNLGMPELKTKKSAGKHSK